MQRLSVSLTCKAVRYVILCLDHEDMHSLLNGSVDYRLDMKKITVFY